MNTIHPSAYVDPKATLGKDNTIGPGCYIGPDVVLGDGNFLQALVCLGAPVPFTHSRPPLVIGDKNQFGCHVSAQSSNLEQSSIGNNCKILPGVALGYDVVLEDDVIIAPNASLCGRVRAMRGANIGVGAVIHQLQTIGSYAMVGAGAVVTKGILIVPGNMYVGNPAKYLKSNDVGLSRARVDKEFIVKEITRFMDFCTRRGIHKV